MEKTINKIIVPSFGEKFNSLLAEALGKMSAPCPNYSSMAAALQVICNMDELGFHFEISRNLDFTIWCGEFNHHLIPGSFEIFDSQPAEGISKAALVALLSLKAALSGQYLHYHECESSFDDSNGYAVAHPLVAQCPDCKGTTQEALKDMEDALHRNYILVDGVVENRPSRDHIGFELNKDQIIHALTKLGALAQAGGLQLELYARHTKIWSRR